MHVEAGERGAGGTLSYVDTVISMCISGHTLVCSSAWNGKMNGTGGRGKKEKNDVVLLVWQSFLLLTRYAGAGIKV